MKTGKMMKIGVLSLIMVGISLMVYAITDQERLQLLEDKFLAGEVSEEVYLELRKKYMGVKEETKKTLKTFSFDFEGDTPGAVPQGWKIWLGSKDIIHVEAEGGVDNSKCLKMDCTSIEWMAVAHGIAIPEVKPNTAYVFSGFIKRGTAEQGPSICCVEVTPNSYEAGIHYAGNKPDKAGEWKKFTTAFRTRADLTTINMVCYNYQKGGVAYFDNLELKEVSEK